VDEAPQGREERVTFGSCFAGVGGFDLGLERAGLACRFQVEIDAFCRRVLARHWPRVERHEDVREISGGRLAWVDVLCGGFPCQDLSIAGKRKGLMGERSGLFFQFTRIAAELRPTWVVIENVDGLLSSHFGADFGFVLRELEDVGYVAGAWRVLDSRWFGVPQRRRRVFIVGCLGGSGRRPESVLFESARQGWDSPPCREARARIANGSGDGIAFALRQDPGGIGQGHNTNFVAENLVPTLLAGGHARPGDTVDDCLSLQVVGPLGGGNDGIGRRSEDDPNLVYDTTQITSKTNRSRPQPGDPCHPLAATAHAPLLASALTASMGHRGYGSPRGDANDNLIAPTLGTSRRGIDVERHHEVMHRGVRRLTPLECERLQGFPDGWTCLCGCEPYSTGACVCKDGPRYKALGNAVTVPVIQWIGERLMEAERAA
jgi:DNA (cytosine-5)-methyltransferase 1